jgi:hypothetical protein
MERKQVPNWDRAQLTDREIYALIRYLDPDPRTTNEEHNDTARVVILVVLVIVWLACIWHFMFPG